jgi:hypothetical protein
LVERRAWRRAWLIRLVQRRSWLTGLVERRAWRRSWLTGLVERRAWRRSWLTRVVQRRAWRRSWLTGLVQRRSWRRSWLGLHSTINTNRNPSIQTFDLANCCTRLTLWPPEPFFSILLTPLPIPIAFFQQKQHI